MTADLFISYAWTSPSHREWVRLLAAHLKAIGHDVLVDVDVDYGDSLSGFMQRAVDARHVLMVVDENYVDRADSAPGSGVAIENGWISSVYNERPQNWLSVMFKDNPRLELPGSPRGSPRVTSSTPTFRQTDSPALSRWRSCGVGWKASHRTGTRQHR